MNWTEIPPTKWWRRKHEFHLRLTWWPSWLAQLLCPHIAKDWVGRQWISGSPPVEYHECRDCHKWFPDLIRPSGETGRRTGLKIQRTQHP